MPAHICSTIFGNRTKLLAAVVGIVAVKVIARVASRTIAKRRHAAELAKLEKNVIHLFSFPRWSGGPNFSTPCFRIEAFLRLAKLPYRIHFTMDAAKSPTERLPYIVYNDTILADSEFISQFLTKEMKLQVDSHLTPKDHALGLATKRLVEGSLQFGSARIMNVDNPAFVAALYSAELGVPLFVAKFFVRGMRKSYIKLLNTVGHGDLTDAQFKSEMIRDYKALEALIGDKPFLLGDRPSSYDCSLYANLQFFIALGLKTPEFDYLRSSAVLAPYVQRLDKILFPDMATVVDVKKAKSQYFQGGESQ
ncbi:glutathione S-transferase, putative [Bodo saltans]|uniref:Glutathione S-transferase, putative n=1 Tax=Bodo saltans TaxID=75058 RepID=A0A0S4JQS8_BODSA|nr:glutathione S-transferase, putative [Bodo saltans]|eukprot:CUG90869.1 glutathione S-transferase, putative [Bodo saltans]